MLSKFKGYIDRIKSNKIGYGKIYYLYLVSN